MAAVLGVQISARAFFAPGWADSGSAPSTLALRTLPLVMCGIVGSPHLAAVHGHPPRIFDSRGIFEHSVGTEGVEESNFRMPGAASADRTGTSFAVTDPGNDRVQVFDAARGDLQNVMAVASQTCGDVVLDAQAARILVSTSTNDRIQVFSMDADI